MIAILKEVFSGIKGIYLFLTSSLAGFFNYIKDFITYLKDTIENFFTSLTDFIIDLLGFFKYLLTFSDQAIKSIFNIATDFFPLIIDFFVFIINKLIDWIKPYVDLTIDTCTYCFAQLSGGLTGGMSMLSGSSGIGQTVWYCLVQADFFGALSIIGCGVLILLTLKGISIVISIFTVGIVRV